MPFKDATSGESSLPTIDGMVTLELLRIEDMPPGQYGDRCRWVFAVSDDEGDITWENGDPYDWWQMTGTSMAMKSTARAWSEALLGRTLEDGEAGQAIQDAIIGCKATAVVAPNAGGFPRIVAMTPLKRRAARARAQVQAAPAPEPDEDEDDSPF